jgi:mono/diheme cytochrome c family protein
VLAACGGERQAESGTGGSTMTGGADTATAAPTTPADTTPAPADTAMPAPTGRDTAGQASADSARKPTRQAQARPKPAAAPAERSPATTPDTQPTQTAQRTGAQPPSGQQQAAPPAQQPAPAAGAANQANAPLRDEYHQAPRDTVSQAVYDGWKQYNLNCARCHGEDVLGTTIAPHLIVSLKPEGPINTQESFTQVVCAGRPDKGMPSWCALGLEMDKINAIYAYVKGRSAGEIGPGRPAVKQEG